jgi:site-specific DNA recombinase
LLQIQGAIAEHERAVLAERFRRGKLQKAREGHAVHARAPYGYRFVARQDGVPARLVIDEAEADLVRQAYAWFIEDRLSLRQLLRRLNFGPWYPRSGRRPWSASTVHHILSDPVYTGTAYANRYEHVAAKKPRARSSEAVPRNSRRLKPKEQWIAIPVPALVDQGTWDRAQEQLARNARLAFRNNAKHNYLLRCMMACGTCGRSMHGRTSISGNGNKHQYYSCAGKDRILSARDTACPQAPIKARDIEHAVWEHVAGLLNDPVHLVAQFERFVTEVGGGTARDKAGGQLLPARLSRLDQADRRLIDAYQAGVLSLEELSDRRQQLANQRRALEQQQKHHLQLCRQHAQTEKVLANIAAFAERIHDRLQGASFADRQAILQLVIERIIVHEGSLEIRHVIPLRHPRPDLDRPMPGQDGRLRSDGEREAEGEPDRVADDLGRAAMAGVAGAKGHGHQARLSVPVCHRKPAAGNLTVPVKLLAAPVRRAAQLSRNKLPTFRNTLSGTTSREPTSPSTPVSVTLELAATKLSGEITVTSPNSCASPLPWSDWPEPVSEVTRLSLSAIKGARGVITLAPAAGSIPLEVTSASSRWIRSSAAASIRPPTLTSPSVRMRASSTSRVPTSSCRLPAGPLAGAYSETSGVAAAGEPGSVVAFGFSEGCGAVPGG